jgi:hypothetical protein
MGLSTPNRIVWRYFSALRRLVQTISATDEESAAEQTALCLMVTVTVVETFVNVFFRVVVSETGFTQHKNRIDRDLRRRASIDHKLRTWPEVVFGRPLERDEPTYSAFLALKERRNALMHFTSSHESFIGSGFAIHGLSNTAVLDDLRRADAVNAIEVAEGMVCLLLQLRGVPQDQLPHGLHAWTGKVP